jgi:hypothetical protein
MSTRVRPYTLSFPEGFDAQAGFELPYRGYLGDVIVEFEDGSRHRLSFIDLARLEQGLNDNVRMGRHYFTEPGLIVLPEVTAAAIQQAVQEMWDEGFFPPDR